MTQEYTIRLYEIASGGCIGMVLSIDERIHHITPAVKKHDAKLRANAMCQEWVNQHLANRGKRSATPAKEQS